MYDPQPKERYVSPNFWKSIAWYMVLMLAVFITFLVIVR
jgi:hypothetical protein